MEQWFGLVAKYSTREMITQETFSNVTIEITNLAREIEKGASLLPHNPRTRQNETSRLSKNEASRLPQVTGFPR
jgi:hypothetical protein